MEPQELEDAIKLRKLPVLELAIAQIFAATIVTGDYQRLNFLLDRAIGKVPVIEPTDEEARALEELRALSDQELIRLVKEKIPELEK